MVHLLWSSVEGVDKQASPPDTEAGRHSGYVPTWIDPGGPGAPPERSTHASPITYEKQCPSGTTIGEISLIPTGKQGRYSLNDI